jgi:hypothetical protein
MSFPDTAINNAPAPGLDERREHVRRMLRVTALVHIGEASIPVQIIDICRAGVAFACEPHLPLQTVFRLSFRLFAGDSEIEVEGHVVYCELLRQSAKYKVGARLHTPSDQAIERIVDFVTSAHPG